MKLKWGQSSVAEPRIFICGYSPGGLEVPVRSRGETPVADLGNEVPIQKLKQFADIICRF